MYQTKRIPCALLIIAVIGLYACTERPSDKPDPQWDHAINFDWKFAKGEQEAAIDPDFDDSAWNLNSGKKIATSCNWAV
jgi:hypothetical protein